MYGSHDGKISLVLPHLATGQIIGLLILKKDKLVPSKRVEKMIRFKVIVSQYEIEIFMINCVFLNKWTLKSVLSVNRSLFILQDRNPT